MKRNEYREPVEPDTAPIWVGCAIFILYLVYLGGCIYAIVIAPEGHFLTKRLVTSGFIFGVTALYIAQTLIILRGRDVLFKRFVTKNCKE